MDSAATLMEGGSADDEDIIVNDCNYDDERWKPEIGMSFASLDEGKSYYGEYALRKGFGWKIRTSLKGVCATKAGNVGVADHEINREISVESTVEVMIGGDVMDATTLSASVYVSTDAGGSEFMSNCWASQCPTVQQPSNFGLGNSHIHSSQVGGQISFMELLSNVAKDVPGLSQLSTNP